MNPVLKAKVTKERLKSYRRGFDNGIGKGIMTGRAKEREELVAMIESALNNQAVTKIPAGMALAVLLQSLKERDHEGNKRPH